MTPPPKKSNKPAGTKKTGAKTGAKVAPAKKTPAKPRRRKKKSGGAGKALLIAFTAGLLLASAAFWFFRDVSLPDTITLTASSSRPAASAVKEAAAPTAKKPVAPAVKEPGRQAPRKETRRSVPDGRGKQQAASSTAGGTAPSGGSTVSGEVRPPSVASAVQSPAPTSAKARGDSQAGGQADGRASGQADGRANGQVGGRANGQAGGREAAAGADVGSAVASALVELQNLPYEESLTVSLDERVRQIDYALMQAAWMRKMPARTLRLFAVEDRLEGIEPYQYQIIDILPGKKPKEFLQALRECLSVWADGASLAVSGTNQWEISVQGVVTHALRLYPGQSSFPLPPGGKPPLTARPETPPEPPLSGMVPPRVRQAGEEAKLVIVMDDLGVSHAAVQTLLGLDYPVTFAFWPHGAHTREGAAAAHARGREILIHQPMEPIGYPKVKPGPNVLLNGMSQEQIRAVLAASVAAVPHAVGLNNHMGSRFTQNAAGVDTVIRFLRERGLFMLDSLTHSRSVFADEGKRLGIAHYRRNVFLDVVHSRAKILEELRRAERIALLTGQAVAIGHPLPETLAALRDWQRLRNRQVRIVRLRDLAQDRN